MKEICEHEKCTGCHTCMSVCPKQCIHMEEDKEGFLYPVIDESKCIDCGLCKKSCMIGEQVKSDYQRKAYAMSNHNKDERIKSSSGGVFTLLAKAVFAEEGVVYGAAFNKQYEVEHIRIDSVEDIKRLRTSKYVQSRIGDVYQQVKSDLDSGKTVLFTGTPCQVGGLKGYLKRDYEKLYCQDIMCHGVPSPKLWRKYLSEISVGTLSEISFRDKSIGWSQFSMMIQGNQGEIKEVFYQNKYMKAFLADIALRQSCTNCNYKGLNYFSDITLADFWGIDKAYPELDNNSGVSLVLANTEKGDRLLKEVSAMAQMVEVDVDKALQGNKPAITNTPPHRNREKFFAHLEDMTVEQLVKKYVQGNVVTRIIKRLLKG